MGTDSNDDGSSAIFGQVKSTHSPFGIGLGQESAIAPMTHQLRERNEETENGKSMREERQNREWRAKHGRTFTIVEPYE